MFTTNLYYLEALLTDTTASSQYLKSVMVHLTDRSASLICAFAQLAILHSDLSSVISPVISHHLSTPCMNLYTHDVPSSAVVHY